jgi:hypothetical protein
VIRQQVTEFYALVPVAGGNSDCAAANTKHPKSVTAAEENDHLAFI